MKKFSTEDYGKISAYLDKEMTVQEASQFETFLNENPEWSNKVEEVKENISLLKRIYLLDSLDEEFDFEKKQSKISEVPVPPIIIVWWKRPMYRRLAFVAMFLAVSIFGVVRYSAWQKEQEEVAELEKRQKELLEKQKQLQIFPVELATKIPSLLAEPVELKGISGKMGEKMTALNEAIDEVAQQDAIKELEELGKPVKVPQEKPTGETYGAGEKSGTVPTPKTRSQITAAEEQYRRLLLGIGYLKENQLGKALVNLDKVNSEQLQADVAWYKSLALIQQKKYAEAKAELQKIESNPQYGPKAKELLGGIPQ